MYRPDFSDGTIGNMIAPKAKWQIRDKIVKLLQTFRGS